MWWLYSCSTHKSKKFYFKFFNMDTMLMQPWSCTPSEIVVFILSDQSIRPFIWIESFYTLCLWMCIKNYITICIKCQYFLYKFEYFSEKCINVYTLCIVYFLKICKRWYICFIVNITNLLHRKLKYFF